MSHPDPPTYRVPPPDCLPDPGRGWRCILIGGLTLLAYLVELGAFIDLFLFPEPNVLVRTNVGHVLRRLFTDPGLNGAFLVPMFGLLPLLTLTLRRNVAAWRSPTRSMVARATTWIMRLRWACLWAVVAGIAIELFAVAASLLHRRLF